MKRNTLVATKAIKERIPYLRCFEEEGMIETSKGVYSRAYFIEGMPDKSIKNMNNKMFMKKYQGLLNRLPGNVNVQFVFHNEQGDLEGFLKQFLVVPKERRQGKLLDEMAEEKSEGGKKPGDLSVAGRMTGSMDRESVKAEGVSEEMGVEGDELGETLMAGRMTGSMDRESVKADGVSEEMGVESDEAGDALVFWVDEYNKTIARAGMLGNNSIKKENYMVLSVRARRPEEAKKIFKELDETVREEFEKLYGIRVRGMEIAERLGVMYAMLNPGRKDFGKKADLRGDGIFRLEDMKKMGLSTKDCIAPETWELIGCDVMRIGDHYARGFFINTLPEAVPMNLIPDVTNISSKMVFSVIYENVDAKVGFEASTRAVTGNTIVRQENKRDTLKDRMEKNVTRTEMIVDVSERAYFERSALAEFKDAVASGNKTMMASFVLVLYSPDPEGLERDTKLLHISCAKFACQIKVLDMQQV